MGPGGIGSSLGPSALRSIAAARDASRAVGTSLERLATGKRINRASDDPAGMMAAENLRLQERVLKGKIESARQTQSYIGAKEGALSVVSDQLLELESLVLASASPAGLSDEEKEGYQLQANSILETIDFLSNTSRYKTEQILTGFNRLTLGRIEETGAVEPGGQPGVGPEGGPEGGPNAEPSFISIGSIAAGGELNLINGDLEKAQQVVKLAREVTSSYRAGLGTQSKSIDTDLNVWMSELEGITGARSQIEDTDYAQETASLVRGQLLQDAALFSAQMSTSLLRSTVSSLLGGAKQGAAGLLAA
jgi:flagellin